MATKKFILCLGGTNAHAVGDITTWLVDHAWADLDNVGNFNVGSYTNTFSMPGAQATTWPNHLQMQQQGVAIPGIRYLVHYNPVVSGYRRYPLKGTFMSTDTGVTTQTFLVQPLFADAGLLDETDVTRDKSGIVFNVDAQPTTTSIRLERVVALPTPAPPGPLVYPELMDPPVEIGEQFSYQLKQGHQPAGTVVTFDWDATATTQTGAVVWNAHGLPEFTPVLFTTSAADLPPELAENTVYYVRNPLANEFQFAVDANPATAILDITDNGTGTHTAWTNLTYVDVAPALFTIVAGGERGAMDGLQLRKSGNQDASPAASRIPVGETRIVDELWWTDVYAAPGKPSRLLISGVFTKKTDVNDIWTLEPQGGVNFDSWCYFFPWSPFEGKDDAFALDPKFNPYPPGFNYPSHVSTPFKYDYLAGPRQIQEAATWHTGLAMRVREALGEDLYVIALGVPESTLAAREKAPNPVPAWHALTTGWFDPTSHLSWSPAMPNGLFQRLSDVLVDAKAAAVLEGNTLECAGIFCSLGESESQVTSAVSQFESNLRIFRAKVRQLISDNALQPTGRTGDEVPFVMGGLPNFVTDFETLNTGIANVMNGDSYSETFTFLDAVADGGTTTFNGAVNGAGMTLYETGAFNGWQALWPAIQASTAAGVSEVDICNLALSYVGDTAKITSISPVDGSEQSRKCASLYPIARDQWLERAAWGFTMRRIKGEVTTNTSTQYDFAYKYPNDALRILTVIPATATDDHAENFVPADWTMSPDAMGAGNYVVRKFSVEALGGQKVVFTDEPNAVLRYSAKITDPTEFSNSFVTSLAWHLASMLAGSVMKGEVGSQESRRMAQMAEFHLGSAEASDAVQTNAKPTQLVPWVTGR